MDLQQDSQEHSGTRINAYPHGVVGKLKRFFRMRFDDAGLEEAFQDDYSRKSLFSIRVSIILAAFLYALFGFLDKQIVPDIVHEAWTIRYAIFCPLALLVFFLTYLEGFRNYLKLGLIVVGFTGGAGILAMIVMANPPGSELYYVGLALTTMFYFVFLRFDLFTASLLAWLIFLLYVVAAIFIKGTSTFILVNNLFFFMAFILAGMAACYWIELYVRSDFLNRRVVVEQAEKLGMIFEHSPVGILHFDSEGVITACNRSFENIIGAPRGRLIGLKMLSDLKDDNIIGAVRECLSGRMATREGAYMSVTASRSCVGKAVFAPVTDTKGQVTGGIGIVEDITDRYETERALRESEASYRSVYSLMRLVCDNVPDLIWTKDLEGRFTFVNRAMVDKLLCAPDTDDPIGRTDMYYAQQRRAEMQDDPQWFTFGEVCVNSDEVINSIKQPKTFDEFGNVRGKFLFLDVYKAPFLDDQGHMMGTVGCGRDVTRERRLETERQEALEALQDSEKKFRFITESVADCVWMMDLNLQTTYVSPSIERLLGFTPEERKSQTVNEQVTPESMETIKDMFAAEMKKELEGGHDPNRNTIMEVEYYRKDGSTIWAENNIRGIRTPDGVLIGLLGLSRDITERKLHQHRLKELNYCLLSLGSDYRENVNRLTALCGELLGATCALYSSLNSGMLCANGQWESPPDLGFSETPEGHICHDVIRNNKQLLVERDLQNSIYARTDPNVVKYSLQSYMGSVVLRGGLPHGALCVVFQRDFVPTESEKHIIQIIASAISSEEERELTWSQLRRRQEMERLLLEISGRFISVSASELDNAVRDSLKSLGSFCDVDRCFVMQFDHRSRTMSNTHEWRSESIVVTTPTIQGYPIESLRQMMSMLSRGQDIHIPDVEKMGDEWKAEKHILEERGVKSLVVVPLFQYDNLMGFVGLVALRGPRVWEEWQFTLLHMYADRLSAAIERKMAEEERNRLNAQLIWSQKMEAIGTLAGGIAHDFNNLLQVILGYSDAMLLNRKADDAEYFRIRQILEAGRKGAELVQRLLTFSRKVEPTLSLTDINQEALQFEAFLSRTIPKTIRIDLKLDEGLKMTLADPSQINQILMNIGVNARDAMPDGGTLTIETQNVELGYEYCNRHIGAKPGSYVMLSMTDTGEGMDKNTLDHIFEPFFTTKKPGQGTGLGLATVYGIVKQHHGYITCYSEPELGTTFRVYLPAVDETCDPIEESEHDLCKGGTETVLLVDDDDDVRRWCGELLEGYGYKVLTAENGEEAIKVYLREKQNIAVALLDLVMPVMDGRKCLQELKKLDPELLVIVTSGYAGTEQRDVMMSMGATAFLAKPCEPSKLLTAIRNVLDR